ncbi:hypothetical protein V2G26_019980 [Clonostachys chloroleuca]
MKLALLNTFISTLAATGAARSLGKRSSGTATVNLAEPIGDAKYLASGFIYGWPDNGVDAASSIPDHFATDIKFNACRAGGAQLPAPSKGWAFGGYEGYIGRFNSTLSNYLTTRKFGGDFILLVHDLWGADGGSGNDALFPGDNGDWTEVDTFIKQLVSDIQANNMLEGLVIDIWNEPELEIFWARTWEQYLEYYVHATALFRTELPNTLISGPSMAHSPSLDKETWRTWVEAVSGKGNIIPDIYSWHQIGGWEREPERTIPEFDTYRANYSLPDRPLDINEYAWTSEQNPANSVFFIAQCERHNARCLRANWGSGGGLHNDMANLVFSVNDTYYPNGEWYLYKYYAEMTGTRVATSISSDLLFDVFATVSDTTAKIIAGTRTVQSVYDIEVSGLNGIGLPEEGSVDVQAYRFDWNGNQADTGSPVDLGITRYEYTSNTLKITVEPPSNSTAFGFEILGNGV